MMGYILLEWRNAQWMFQTFIVTAAALNNVSDDWCTGARSTEILWMLVFLLLSCNGEFPAELYSVQHVLNVYSSILWLYHHQDFNEWIMFLIHQQKTVSFRRSFVSLAVCKQRNSSSQSCLLTCSMSPSKEISFRYCYYYWMNYCIIFIHYNKLEFVGLMLLLI